VVVGSVVAGSVVVLGSVAAGVVLDGSVVGTVVVVGDEPESAGTVSSAAAMPLVNTTTLTTRTAANAAGRAR
jgi:hypothetical protein